MTLSINKRTRKLLSRIPGELRPAMRYKVLCEMQLSGAVQEGSLLLRKSAAPLRGARGHFCVAKVSASAEGEQEPGVTVEQYLKARQIAWESDLAEVGLEKATEYANEWGALPTALNRVKFAENIRRVLAAHPDWVSTCPDPAPGSPHPGDTQPTIESLTSQEGASAALLRSKSEQEQEGDGLLSEAEQQAPQVPPTEVEIYSPASLGDAVSLLTELIKAGHVLLVKHDGKKTTAAQEVKDLDALSLYLENGALRNQSASFELDLKPSARYPGGLICIDIDNPRVWQKVAAHTIREALESDGASANVPLINPSTRGGHLIYRRREKGALASGQNALLNLGFRADVLTNRVIVVGEGKSIEAPFPDLANLPVCPPKLDVAKEQDGRFEFSNTPLVEGQRNTTLFNFLNTIPVESEGRVVIGLAINSLWCEPPLPEVEVVSLAERAGTAAKLMTPSSTVSEDNQEVADRANADFKLFQEYLGGKFVYNPQKSMWFEWTGTHYTVLDSYMFDVRLREVVYKLARSMKTSLKATKAKVIASEMKDRLANILHVNEEMLDVPLGKNFTNGYLRFDTGELVAHNPKWFVLTRPKVAFDPNEPLSETWLKVLSDVSRNNMLVLLGIRLMIRLALEPNEFSQIAFIVYGPPMATKSLLMEVLQDILGESATTLDMSGSGSAFVKFTLHNKTLIVVNEAEHMDQKEVAFVKRVLGRDFMGGEVKYGDVNIQFQVVATMVFVTNKHPKQIFDFDPALGTRLLPLPFAPFLGAPDPYLKKKLLAEQSGLISWALGLPKECLEANQRVGHLTRLADIEENATLLFMTQQVVRDPNGRIPEKLLHEKIHEFAKVRGLQPPEKQTDWIRDFPLLVSSIFRFQVNSDKVPYDTPTKVKCFLGIRFGEVGEETIPTPKADLDPRTREWVGLPMIDFDKNPDVPHANIVEIKTRTNLAAKVDAYQRAAAAERQSRLNLSVHQMRFPDSKVGYPGVAIADPALREEWSASPSLALRALATLVHEPGMIAKAPPQELKGFDLKASTEKELKLAGIAPHVDFMKDRNYTPCEPLTAGQTELLFNNCLALFLVTITRPLEGAMLESLARFTPSEVFGPWAVLRERCEIVGQVGQVANFLEHSLGRVGDPWAQVLRALRDRHPTVENINNKKLVGGRLLPYLYLFGENDYFRYNSWPPYTARDCHKLARAAFMREMARITGLQFYDVDASACHMRAMTLFIDPIDGPYLHKAVGGTDLWSEMANDVVAGNPTLGVIPHRVLRQAIKIKMLALINGGFVTTKHHVANAFENKVDSVGNPCEVHVDAVLELLQVHPAVTEFRASAERMSKFGFLYSLVSPHRVSPRSVTKGRGDKGEGSGLAEDTSLNSRVFASVESVVVSYLAQFGSVWKHPLVMVMTVHDGAVFMSKHSWCTEDQVEFDISFREFLRTQLELDMPVEFVEFQ